MTQTRGERAGGATRRALARFAPRLGDRSASAVGHDLVAGLAVAAVAIPQAVAYAFVAGLPPEMGVLAAALPCVVAALFGSSPHLITGPTNPTALVLGLAVVAPAVAATGSLPMQAVLATGFLTGAMLLGFGLVGVGRVSRFLSDSVVIGFATGAGLLIALRLVPELTPGLPPAPHPGGFAPSSWPVFVDATRALIAANPRALLLALGTPVAIVAIRRLDPRLPGAVIALAGATLLAAALGWTPEAEGIARIGQVEMNWAAPALPGSVQWRSYVAPAFALALLVTVQSVASARSVRPIGVPFRLDTDRELFSQGVGNLVSAAFGGMVTSGSLTRSAIARSAGGRSRTTGMAAGVAIALGLPFLGSVVAPIPMAAIVGVVFLSGIELVRVTALRRAATTRGDALVLLATLAATLTIDLVQALYLGVFLSLILLVRRSGRLQMTELCEASDGRFSERALDASTGRTPVVLLHLEGDLNFAVSQELTDRLAEIGVQRPSVIVLRMKRVTYLDATVLESLRESVTRLQARGMRFLLCGLTDAQLEVLADGELAQALGEEGLLRTGARLFDGFEEALRQAKRLAPEREDGVVWRRESSAMVGRPES